MVEQLNWKLIDALEEREEFGRTTGAGESPEIAMARRNDRMMRRFQKQMRV